MEDKLKQLEMKLRVWYGVWLDSRTKKYLYKLYEKNPNEAMRIIGEINRRSKELPHDEYGYRVMVDDKGKLYFRLACPECGSIEFVEDIERVCTNCAYVIPSPSFASTRSKGIRGGAFDVEDPNDINELFSHLFEKKFDR